MKTTQTETTKQLKVKSALRAGLGREELGRKQMYGEEFPVETAALVY